MAGEACSICTFPSLASIPQKPALCLTHRRVSRQAEPHLLVWLFLCLVLIKKMHELRSSQVTSVEFESCHLHILRFYFALFAFSR